MLQSSVLDLQRPQMEGGIYHSGTLFRSPSIKRADGNAVFSAYMLDPPFGAPLLQDLLFLLFRESRNHPSTVSGKMYCPMWRYRRKLIGEGKTRLNIFFNAPSPKPPNLVLPAGDTYTGVRMHHTSDIGAFRFTKRYV